MSRLTGDLVTCAGPPTTTRTEFLLALPVYTSKPFPDAIKDTRLAIPIFILSSQTQFLVIVINNMHSAPLFVIGALLVSCTHAFVTPVNSTERRATATVYTKCTQPKTVAITYVAIQCATSGSNLGLSGLTTVPTRTPKASSIPLTRLEERRKSVLL